VRDAPGAEPGTTDKMISSDGRTFSVATGRRGRVPRSSQPQARPVRRSTAREDNRGSQPRRPLAGHAQPGKRGGMIQLWDLRTREAARTAAPHPGDVTDVVSVPTAAGWPRSAGNAPLPGTSPAARGSAPAPKGTRLHGCCVQPRRSEPRGRRRSDDPGL
jgi:hypothetical protein